MSFKRNGAPEKNLEIIDFTSDKAASVDCHKCGKNIGKKSAGLFKPIYSEKPLALSAKFELTCPHCKEKTYGL